MGITFSVGGKTFATNSIPDTSSTAARIALACAVDAPQYGLIRFHVPGTNGNLVVREGRTGQPIRIRARYIGALTGTTGNADTLFQGDCTDWSNTAVTIVDNNGVSYTNCNLVPGTMRKVTVPKPTGRAASQAWFDVEAEFTVD